MVDRSGNTREVDCDFPVPTAKPATLKKRSQPTDSIVRKLYALLAQCHRQLGQGAEGLAACVEGRRYYPDDAELLFQEALIRISGRDYAGAEACLLRLIHGRDGEHFGSVADGLRGFRARHNLGVVYSEQGRLAEAEAQWRAALAERPDFVPAWLGLGEMYARLGRSDELEDAARQLEGVCGDTAQAALVRARGHMARQEFGEARWLLAAAAAQSSGTARVWEVLSHALLQEGKDWGEAERVLRKVLELQPGNVEARRNLEILLREHGPGSADERG